MALTVTPGGVADDALVTLADFKSYCDDRGHAYGTDDLLVEKSIRRATVWVEGVGVWPGKKAAASQRRIWPRVSAFDVDGVLIDSSTIPLAVQDAVCEAAVYDINNAGILHTAVTPTDVVKSESIGSSGIKTEYRDKIDIAATRTMLTVVADLLSGILVPDTKGPRVFMTSLGG